MREIAAGEPRITAIVINSWQKEGAGAAKFEII
jgi:hypothetical protein